MEQEVLVLLRSWVQVELAWQRLVQEAQVPSASQKLVQQAVLSQPHY